MASTLLIKNLEAETEGGVQLKAMADRILDLRGMIIPMTFLKTTQVLRAMKPGETIEILLSDPNTRGDLFKILRAFSYELKDIDDDQALCRIHLKKGR